MIRARQFMERCRLAWGILTNTDTALTNFVRSEVARVDRSVELHAANMARVFALEGHSGGSAPIMIDWLQRALSWQPIAPLTGKADEWMDVAEQSGRTLWQNKRCGRVFKEGDGRVYDSEGRIFREPSGACFQSIDSRVPVVFPYTPTRVYVDVPELAP